MNNYIIDKIKELFKKYFNSKKLLITKLKQSGSYREYYRIKTNENTIIAVYNPDRRENDAFVSFSQTFGKLNLNVPEIYKYFPEEKIYFLQDLGDTTFYDYLQTKPSDEEKLKFYKKILDNLIVFQYDGGKNLDYSLCVPKDIFDEEAILWDLNYFKYFVLKYGRINFDEAKLQSDFENFAHFLVSAGTNNFMYRDFQSKNIMLKDDELYFIDYQGGRKGAIYYDLVSLLYDNKAKLNDNLRDELKKYYFSLVQNRQEINISIFDKYYYAFALIRQMQAFAAYVFRGLIEKKIAFISSIPLAIQTVKKILDFVDLNKFTELKKVLTELVGKSYISDKFSDLQGIKLRINSFSFRDQGYPPDEKGNGGGFVFDCRLLPNPGRYAEYKPFTGLDANVKEFLSARSEVETFIGQAVEIIVDACHSYIRNGYTDLQVNFGCTGGRHRSVYCAEKTAEFLKNVFNADVEIRHLNLERMNYKPQMD